MAVDVASLCTALIAAYSALSTAGPYDITYRYYRPIPEFIAGFSVTTALPRTHA